jgi:hypothetical protein
MASEVEFTEEFEQWWNILTPGEQESMDFSVRLLEEQGVHLKRPHAYTVNRRSKYPNMRELRRQHQGRPYRILFAFDPRRVALLLGGDKDGQTELVRGFRPCG